MDEGFQLPGSSVYVPTGDEATLITDTTQKRSQWRDTRRPYEQHWFIATAFYRGNHYVEWDERVGRIAVPKAPRHRVRLRINRLQSKIRARLSKFLKNRPIPIVVPATNEYDDYLDAKATQKTLDYLWRKLRLEHKLRDVLHYASTMSKGFWWFHWNPSTLVRVAETDPATGARTYSDQPLGEIEIEVGSPFELLVADPGAMHIAEQPEIMRVRLQKVTDVQARYPEMAAYIVPSAGEEGLFTYEEQIAGLAPGTGGGITTAAKHRDREHEVLVTEHFIRPCGKYPQGHYRVLVGDVLVRVQDALPYGFDQLENPFPCVEFPDLAVPGQFWGTTVADQLIDLQREYNLLRSKLLEHLKLMAFPKILAAKQHQLPKSAWTSEAGELIEYTAIPNLRDPTPWHPPPIISDLWRCLEIVQKEFDDVTQIFPASEGKAAGATSGFQTNLLQEATDSVHAPDIRQMELAVEEACLKLRRMAKLGYTVPRLITAVGRNYAPEVFEFVNDQIDEMADVVVEVGSGLPTMKAAKQDAVMKMYQTGLLGDPVDLEVRRKTLALMEMGAADEAFDLAKTDENQASLENKALQEGRPIEAPHFWENHQVHYNLHTTLLKSPESRDWPEQVRRALVAHVILHARYINPQSALQIAMEEQIPEVIEQILPMLPPPMAAPPGGPSAEPGGPPPPPPEGAPV